MSKVRVGDLIGLGIAKREDKLTSFMVRIPENSLNSLIDVACEEKSINCYKIMKKTIYKDCFTRVIFLPRS